MTGGNSEVIKKIRDVIQSGGNIDINTRDILLFSAIADIYDQYDELKKENKAIREEVRPALDFYRVAVWVSAAFGISFIGLVFAMLTGQVELVFK